MEHESKKLEKLIEYNEEHINSQVLLKNDDCLALIVALKKNQKMQEHFSPINAFIFVIEGEIDFHLINDTQKDFEIKEDEIFFFKANEKHSITAKKDSKMLVIRI